MDSAGKLFGSLCLLGVICPAPRAGAGSPSLEVVLPRGAQRGTAATVDFSGAHLDKALSIVFYRPGVTLNHIEQVSDKHVRCTLAIAADCALGLHPLRLFTASGLTELRLFAVGDAPEITEQEPNDARSAPQLVRLPVTINGQAAGDDLDCFGFEAQPGARLAAEIEGMRLGGGIFDPVLTLYDAQGKVLATADDNALTKQDPVLSYSFASGGTYIVEVRDAAYRGERHAYYRLHLGDFPRPMAVFPPGGAPGQAVEVRWVGDSTLARETIAVPNDAGADYAIFVRTGAGTSLSPVPFRVNGLPQTIEAEPNDSPESATPCTVPGALNGIVTKPGDVDWFRFSAAKGQVFDCRVYARQLGSPLDAVVGVNKLGGATVASNDDSAGPDSAFRLTIPDDGDYALYIHDFLRAGGECYTYRVEVTNVTPALTLSTPPDQQHVCIPQGNRNAIVINAARSDFGGPLQIELSGLPAGLTASGDTMRDNVAAVPIVLTAEATAPLAASLVDVIGQCSGESKIVGHLRQSIRLTEYMNNTLCAQTVDRLPVAVTERVPFEVQIIEPRVPLARRGQMSLKVVATRGEGFKEPIQVGVLLNPPGIGSGTATIGPDQTEALLPLNANPDAALGEWPIVAIASANINGLVQVSSQLARLTIAEPFMDLALERTRVSQGSTAEVVVNIAPQHDFEGEAVLELRGLPNKLSATPAKATKETKQVVLPVAAAPDAPLGRHEGVFVQVTVMQNGEPIVFNSASALLIVDRPPAETASAQPAPVGKAERRARTPRARDIH